MIECTESNVRRGNANFVGRTTGLITAVLLALLMSAGDERPAADLPSGFIPQSTHLPDGGVTLPWDADEDMPVVPIMIDGAGPFRFLVDTGASSVVIDERLADRLGLARQGTPVAIRTAANDDIPSAQPAVIRSLTIGDAHFREFQAHVVDFARMEIDGDMSVQFEGVIGSSLFAHALLTVDYPGRSIHLAHGSLPDLNDKDVFLLRVIMGRPHVLVRLETATQSQEHWAVIDTGHNGSLGVGTEWGLQYAAGPIDGGLTMTASGLVPDEAARIARMRMGDLTFVGPRADICAEQRIPRIGQRLLERLRLSFDYNASRVRIQGSERTIGIESRSPGFAARPSRRPGREGRIVSWIAAGSPAAQVLQLGDLVVTVNGQSTARMSNRSYRELLEQHGDIDLGILRNGMNLQTSLAAYDDLPWKPSDAPVAASGSIDAFVLYCRAGAYRTGEGAPKNEAKAVELYRKSAVVGVAGAHNTLAGLILRYMSLPMLVAAPAAWSWFRRSAEQGYPMAQCNLGHLYANGMGVGKDETKAFAWYLQAATQGDIQAQCIVAGMYKKGRGVARNDEACYVWYHKAALQGHVEAQSHIGGSLLAGIGVPKDEAKAAEWFRKAANQGDARAQLMLGGLYSQGMGLARDYGQAFTWFTKAAEQGFLPAYTHLAVCYLMGFGVEKDTAKGRDWLLKATKKGDADAQNTLGKLYAQGLGVERDLSEARRWFELAAKQGHPEAIRNLKTLDQSTTTP